MNEAKIIGMKNYSSSWINGSTNHKTSCVVDHANSDQQRAAAMNHVKAHLLLHFRQTELSNSGGMTAKQPGELTKLPEKSTDQGPQTKEKDVCTVPSDWLVSATSG